MSIFLTFQVEAASRKPELSYGGYKTAIDLKRAAYSSWIRAYGKYGCDFGQWNWIQNANSITGIPNTNQACGSGHVASTWEIKLVCPPGYIPDNANAPADCTLPEDTVDPAKETGSPDDGLNCSTTKSRGNPINIATGNKFQTEVDYIGAGSYPLQFVRKYNSQDGMWRHNYSAHLRIATDNIVMVAEDGRESYFELNGNFTTPEPNELGVLRKQNDQWVYSSPQNQEIRFDENGRLVRISRSPEDVHTLEYDDLGFVVSDSLNNAITIHLNSLAKGQPLKLIANGIQITYGYNSQGNLITRNLLNGTVSAATTYNYEDGRNLNLLTGITDERGIRYATWKYDTLNRAVLSEHANGAEQVKVIYNPDESTTVTNALGQQSTYQFEIYQGIKRITAIEGHPSANCPNSNSTFTYDERGLLKTKTDNQGNMTTYDYNTRGLEVSRTEAAGTPQARTITTDWHPTLFLPVTVTEPARTTTYTYDVQGRQLSQSVTQR
jgi:YD repeat-containing protein